MGKNEIKSLTRARDFIFKKTSIKPEIGVILGSGLGAFAEQLKDSTVIPYSKIPGFQRSQVKGHSNELFLGKLRNKTVAVMKGRYHYYEGYSIFDVTFPVRTLHALGVKKLIITNAAGSLKKSIPPGSLMFIKDHINLSGKNPLIGISSEFGEKFVDLTDAYSKKLLKPAQAVAKKLMIKVKSGVYVFLTGPSYETPAEVKMLEKLGGTAVGMSTVPEV
ncbi:purine-nucleoside phosphorylase, partial [Candidatus Dependentiae bacterium]|nr:purine-nucleoside phosphorylase [Candidatus Dependentiae bacterium]